MKVLMVGDTHGNPRWMIKAVYPAAKALEIDLICSLGDFGFWPDHNGNNPFLDTVSELAFESDIPLYFIDGNHENHDQLDHDADEFVEILTRLYYIPRGHAWTWGQTDFVALGGAWSIDHKYRTLGFDLFREEEPDKAQIERAMSHTADVVLTHDCTIPAFDYLYPPGYGRVEGGMGTRRAIGEVAVSSGAALNIHGHHHHSYSKIVRLHVGHPTETSLLSVGLANEFANRNMLILNTDFDKEDPNWIEGFVQPKWGTFPPDQGYKIKRLEDV